MPENRDRRKKPYCSQYGKERRVEYRKFVVQFSESDEKKDPLYGGVAQLGEHLPCKQGVKSSNLFISTRLREAEEEKPKRELNKRGEVVRTQDWLIAQQARARA